MMPALALLLLLSVATPQALAAKEKGQVVEKFLVEAGYCGRLVLTGEQVHRTVSARSKVECAAFCRLDDNCRSIIYDPRNARCQVSSFKADVNCSNMEPSETGALFYQEPLECAEGEAWAPNGLCVCAPGFDGSPCTRYFHDCEDHYLYGDWMGDGIYTVHPLKSPEPFEVYCRHITNTRLHILVRKKKRGESFDRPWSDYREGFGKLTGDFWVGLEKLYTLTTDRAYELRVVIRLANNSNVLQYYEHFRISDEASGYSLNFNTSVLNGENDCFLNLEHVEFSTKDRDSDGAPDINCAAVRKGGFWYSGADCGACNPLGIMYRADDGMLTGAADEAFFAFLGNVAPYKVSMYLIPRYQL